LYIALFEHIEFSAPISVFTGFFPHRKYDREKLLNLQITWSTITRAYAQTGCSLLKNGGKIFYWGHLKKRHITIGWISPYTTLSDGKKCFVNGNVLVKWAVLKLLRPAQLFQITPRIKVLVISYKTHEMFTKYTVKFR
jgi:hypothetical protein